MIAFGMFFSWIMLINGLRIPFYLYYARTIFLIYLGRSFDWPFWLLFVTVTLALTVAGARSRSVSFWLSILLLSSGTIIGTSMAGEPLSVVGYLATLAGCVSAVIMNPSSLGRRYFAAVLLSVLSLLLLPVEVESLLHYVVSAFHPGTMAYKSLELFELQFWYAAYPLVLFMYAAFLLSWLWAPFVTKVLLKSGRLNESAKVREAAGPGPVRHGVASTSARPGENRSLMLMLAAYASLALFIGYYAYLHDPSYPLVGTDIYWRYALPAERVLSSSSWLAAAAIERHPLVVLGIAAASHFLGLPVESLLRFAYVALVLALGASFFLVVLHGSGDKTLACLTALMATVTAPTTANIFTGTVAEWTALTLWILSLGLLLAKKGSLRRRVLSIVGLGLGSVVVLFVHPWTWTAMMVSLVAYCLVAVILRDGEFSRDVDSILVVILLNVIVLALSLSVLWRTQGWRIVQAFAVIQDSLRSKYLGFGGWEIAVSFSQNWSQFLHPVVLFLAILGIVVLARRLDRFTFVVLAWIFTAFMTTMIAAPKGYHPGIAVSESVIFRAMCLTPFQIPAAAGLSFLKSKLDVRLGPMNPNWVRTATAIAVGVIFLAMLNGAFRALYPLLTDPHNYPNPMEP